VNEIAIAPRQHRRQHGTNSVYVTHDVDLPLLLPCVHGCGNRITPGCHRCIAKEQVNLPELCFTRFNESTHVFFLPDIARDCDSANVIGNCARAFHIYVSNRDFRPFRAKSAGTCPTNPARASCNHYHASVQFHNFFLLSERSNLADIAWFADARQVVRVTKSSESGCRLSNNMTATKSDGE
jgi:hypothetical protein